MKSMTLFVIFFLINLIYSQVSKYGAWTTLKAGTKGQKSNYTMKAETPGYRVDAASFLIEGSTGTQFIVVGGYGTDKDGNTGTLNDVWRYHLNTSSWENLIEAPMADSPASWSTTFDIGGRKDCAFCQTASKRVLFGGRYGNGTKGLNDMWQLTDSFTWKLLSNFDETKLRSNKTAGILGAREGALMFCGYSENATIIFGGYGSTESEDDVIASDVWKFDFPTKEFTYIGGSETGNDIGEYVAAVKRPAARLTQGWMSPSSTKEFYIFGGRTNEATVGDRKYFSDLWKFNVDDQQWSLIVGSNTTDEAETATVIGARAGFLTFIQSYTNKQLMLLGGTNKLGDRSNDVWVFDLSNSAWEKADLTVTPSYPKVNALGWQMSGDTAKTAYVFSGANSTNAENGADDLWKLTWFQPTDPLFDILLIVFLVVVPFTFFAILVIVFLLKAIIDQITKRRKKVSPRSRETELQNA